MYFYMCVCKTNENIYIIYIFQFLIYNPSSQYSIFFVD